MNQIAEVKEMISVLEALRLLQPITTSCVRLLHG